jgi:hypothetical protein
MVLTDADRDHALIYSFAAHQFHTLVSFVGGLLLLHMWLSDVRFGPLRFLLHAYRQDVSLHIGYEIRGKSATLRLVSGHENLPVAVSYIVYQELADSLFVQHSLREHVGHEKIAFGF